MCPPNVTLRVNGVLLETARCSQKPALNVQHY
jgi:hypothetical protein